MAHTHQTPNFGLPQFIGTDKPAWLEDFNQSMQVIDTALAQNRASSEGAAQAATAAEAISDSAKTIAEAANTLSNQAVSDAGIAKGAQNWTHIEVATGVKVSYNGFMSVLRLNGTLSEGAVTGNAIPVNVFGLVVSTDSNATTLVTGIKAYWDGAATHIIATAGEYHDSYVTAI